MLEKIKELITNLIQQNILYSLVVVYALTLITCTLLIFYMQPKKSDDEFGMDGVIEQETESENINESLFVEISGAIKDPGVYELRNGERLVDLVKIAGGFSTDASEEWISRFINLSLPLKDSQKIYVPYKWDDLGGSSAGNVEELLTLVKPYTVSGGVSFPTTSGSVTDLGDGNSTTVANSSSSVLININTASQEDIDGLPGIGPVYAARFIENRPYEDVAELKEKSGVSESVIDKIKDLITY